MKRHALVVVIMATLLSTFAMVAYPLLARHLQLAPAAAGLFIGGSIHDVAQVVVAGYAVSPAVGDAALIVKLLRVSLLFAVVLGMSAACHAPCPSRPLRQRASSLVPPFLWLFAALAALNSLHVLRLQACLMLGVAGLGMKTSFGHLASAGWRPLLLMAATSAWLAGLTLAAALQL